MNRKIGMGSSIINAVSVFIFAVSMLLSLDYLSYLSSMFIAISFIPIVCTHTYYSSSDRKSAGYTAVAFSAIYATIILIIYFTQLTAVYHGELSTDALDIMDYQRFGLFFSLNLFGYGMMALSTFFIGLLIENSSKKHRWLRNLLLIHGIFFISGLIVPMLGVFNAETQGADWMGILILLLWSIYFIPIGILSYSFFKDKTI